MVIPKGDYVLIHPKNGECSMHELLREVTKWADASAQAIPKLGIFSNQSQQTFSFMIESPSAGQVWQWTEPQFEPSS